jgi:hypothetical protein
MPPGLLPADLPEAQVRLLLAGCDQLARRANQQNSVQPISKKYSASRAAQISPITPPVSSTKGALATSRTRGEMRWTRMAQLTLAPDADGEVVWFWRRGAGAKFFEKQASQGRRWQKSRSPGRARSKP